MKLSNIVRPDTRIARSINLARDLTDPETLDRYVLTGKGLEIIHRLTAGLNGQKISAWSLTGPYGMGKSAFVHFLLSFCGNPVTEPKTRSARNMLEQKDSALSAQLMGIMKKRRFKSKGFFRVPATASFEPVNRTLGSALAKAVRAACESDTENNAFHQLDATLVDFLSKDNLDAAHLVDLFQEAGRISRSPLAVVIDEFGKNLEYLARYPAQGDLFILQTLAETENIFLWVCLHQAFEAYASSLTRLQRQEWGKVQGRFEDISFVEPRTQMLDFIGKTLVRTDLIPEVDRAYQNWTDYYQKEFLRLGVTEIAGVNMESLEHFFPLHPVTAALLPELCTRFAQNDRTLFAFLCSGEPNALRAFLETIEINENGDAPPTLGPEQLYDYFLGATPSLSLSRPGAGRWLEIHDMVEGARDLPEAQRNLLKIIGLLNLISGLSGFRASRDLLRFAVSRPGTNADNTLASTLTPLSEKGILIYREYADEFRLWEGTDIDIPATIDRYRPIIAARPLAELIEKVVPMLPLMASRHSYCNGTLRHFQRRWCGSDNVHEAVVAFEETDADGLFLYVFGNDVPLNGFPDRTADGRPVIVAFAREEDRLRERVIDATAAAAVLTEAPELERDGVARREARFRASATEDQLKRFLADLYTPGNPDIVWQSGEKQYDLRCIRDLSGLLSHLCDETYHSCPVIRNELINRSRLSSAATRAQRELIQAMLNGETKEKLGLSGTGPEVAIYRTMLAAEGLHKFVDMEWRFFPPEPRSHFYAAWQAIDTAVNRSGDALLPLPELIAILRRPPFGMKLGPIPVLICLYLLTRSDDTALYQEGAFIPYLTPEDLELMVKRPEYFEIRKFSPIGIQGKVFRIYQELLSSSPVKEDRQLRNATMVNIVGPLVQFADRLPTYVKETRSISREARNLLQALLNSKDPIDLLFMDLPKAVGVSHFDDTPDFTDDTIKEFQNRFRNAVVELSQAFEHLVDRIRMILQEAFGNRVDLKAFREDMKERAAPLLSRCSDKRLKPLVSVLTRDRGTDNEWVSAIGTIVSQRPVESWRDADLNSFSTHIHDLARRFLAMERLAAAERQQLPKGKEGKEARLISLTRPDGTMESEIVWTDWAETVRVKEKMDRLIKENEPDQLKALLVMLGEHVLGEREPKDQS
jgi:hypothetical protein